MYQCSSCGGNLKFDIVRQQLSCEHCGTKADPYSFYKEKDAEERAGEYEVTVFACPQCGSELMSEDTTASTFCSFCGASTILDRRIRRERRPEYILPFTKTKEDCRAAYGRMLRRAVFAPKELKDETLIEKFRGIYMPYWVYSFEKNEGIVFPGSKTCRSGDYLITDHYELKSQVEANYEGLSYDASSTFADSLSDAIAPFDLRQKKDFAPSFLSGFYADTNDVEDYVYMQEAEDFVLKDACRCLAREPVCRRHGAERGGRESQLWNALRPSGRKAELAMLPVWFLSYRNGDRVSYAVVNGQTGKAAADLPVDRKKYLLGSLFLALPIFFLLNAFFTITPGKILQIAVLLAALCLVISNEQITHILARESREEDRGYSYKKPEFQEREARARKRKSVLKQPENFAEALVFVTFAAMGAGMLPLLLMPILLVGVVFFDFNAVAIAVRTMVVCMALAGLFASVHLLNGLARQKSGKPARPFMGGHFKEKRSILIKPLGGIVLALLIWVINPVFDIFYYIGALGCMGTAFWAILDIMKQHNLLATRKLPQLNRRGGDEIG